MKDLFKYADKESPMFNELSELKKEFVNFMQTPQHLPKESKNLKYWLINVKGLSEDDAVKTMRQMENILHSSYKSKSPKRQRRRESRENLFNKKYEL